MYRDPIHQLRYYIRPDNRKKKGLKYEKNMISVAMTKINNSKGYFEN
jgi:hypothetical protein